MKKLNIIMVTCGLKHRMACINVLQAYGTLHNGSYP